MSKYSDSFWDDLEAEITTWDWKKRLGERRVLKREIEKFAPEGKRNERVEFYSELQGYTDVEGQRIDLHFEWIYRRILSHLWVSPIIKKEYEIHRRLHKKESAWFRKRSRRVERSKGNRKPRGEYTEDYPSLDVDPVEEVTGIEFFPPLKEVTEIKGVGGIVTFDDEGNPTTRVKGYGIGRPLEADKLEDELFSDIHNFLTKRGLQVTTVNRLLVSMSQFFLGKVIRGRAIQKRIRRHPN